MTRDEALAIARRAQKEPTPIGVTMPDMLAERTSDDLLKAFDAGAEAERAEMEPQIKLLETMLREDR